MVLYLKSSVRSVRLLVCLWAWPPLLAATGVQEVTLTNSVVQGRPLTVEERPLLTLGAAEGDLDEEFFKVKPPTLLPGGQVVVPLAAYGEIRVFTQDGELAATHGRPGEGPGEFRDLESAWTRGDTIEAFDGRLRRVTRFWPDGTIETVPIDLIGAGYRPSSAIRGTFRDGWALMGITDMGYGRRDEVTVSHFSRDGTFVAIIARAEGIFRYEAPGMTGPTPLSPSVSFAIMGDALYVGETLSPAIGVVGGDGSVVNKITWEPGRTSPRDALREVVRLAVQNADPGDRVRVRERLNAAPAPNRVPLFSAFLVDGQGFVWVRPYEVERDAYALGGPLYGEVPAGGVWWIFTPEGERVGSIDLPADLEPSVITADAVVGIRRDELGIEYVQIHRLHRR